MFLSGFGDYVHLYKRLRCYFHADETILQADGRDTSELLLEKAGWSCEIDCLFDRSGENVHSLTFAQRRRYASTALDLPVA